MTCEVRDVYPANNVTATLSYGGREYSPSPTISQPDIAAVSKMIKFIGNVEKLNQTIGCSSTLDVPGNSIENTTTLAIGVKGWYCFLNSFKQVT